MLKRHFVYTDYNGNKKEEDVYFNLSNVELQRILNSKKGGLEAALEEMVKEEDLPNLFDFIEKLILSSYGRQTENGGFEKNPELAKQFSFTVPYDLIFTEITNSEESLLKFLEEVIPTDQAEKIKVALAQKAEAK